MKKIAQLITLLVFISFTGNCQKKEKTFDPWLDYEYKYLTDDFSINIDSKTFRKAAKKFNFKKSVIDSKNDSIFVILWLELDEYYDAIAAWHQVVYSWKRFSYHTWQTPEEARKFAARFNITHPWRMNEFLWDDTNHNPEIIKFIDAYKTKLLSVTTADSMKGLNRYELFTLGMRINPERIKDFETRQKQRKGCGKSDCCKGKNANKPDSKCLE